MSFFFGAGDEARTRFRTHKSCAFVGPPTSDWKKRGYTAFLGGGSEFLNMQKRHSIWSAVFLEQVTRLELATSTLARWRSTR